jgi:hypothetical protein
MKKIIGILIVTLLIGTVIPAVGTINKTTEEKTPQTQNQDSYDLVIIAPSAFSSNLQRLIDHKNQYGVNTILKTTEDIYNEFSGVDKPEQIKYFIKDAFDTWNITYVLLVGGLNSYISANLKDDRNQGSTDWYIPVRYSNLDDGYENGYICDLYYADLYDSEGNFSSWDSDRNGNSDGIFAYWTTAMNKDVLDLYPDVYVGRLACRNEKEVDIMVEKIINYESTPADPSWFKKIVVAGGENWDDDPTNYLEGEVICEEALSYMTDFTPVKLYASHRDTGELIPSPNNIISSISDGCGFLFMSGFGDPSGWTTRWPGVFNWDDYPGHLRVYHFLKLSNEHKLPISIIGADKVSQFNVTLMATLLGKSQMATHNIPIAECTSWHLTRKSNGGSIATIGSAAACYGAYGEKGDMDGDGINEPDCIEQFSGYLSSQLLKTYNDGKTILGEMFGETLSNYIDTFECMNDKIDCKVVQAWTLLGDPSLKIGGYP